MNKIKGFAWVLCMIATVFVCVGILLPLYNSNDAKRSLGKTYDINENWTLTDEDGTTKRISLPYTFFTNGKKYTLTHPLDKDHLGLEMNIKVRNAAVRTFLKGRGIPNADENDEFPPNIFGVKKNAPSFEAAPLAGDNMEFTKDSPPPPDISGKDPNAPSAGEIMDIPIDLPEAPETKEINFEIYAIDKSRDVSFEDAVITRRFAAVISTIQQSIIPMLICLMILICSVILITLDLIRVISKKRSRRLSLLSILGIHAILFCMTSTGLIPLLLGNKAFFDKIGYLCVTLMPPYIAMFYRRGFKIHFPKLTGILLWSVTGITVITVVCELFGVATLLEMGFISFGMLMAMSVTLIAMLFYWKYKKNRNAVIWMDTAAVLSFMFAMISGFIGNIVINIFLTLYLKDVFMLLFFLFITAQHVYIMYREHRKNAEKNARNLREQVRIAEEAKAEAMLANEAKGRFLANMSHEIRTPINAVLGMDEMILREAKEKNIKGYAMDIFTAGQTLLSLINDILDFSKIESGKMEIVPVDYDISSLINDLYNMVSSRAKTKDLSLELSVNKDIPARYMGDDVRIRQVLTNILTNAVKYTHEGHIYFRIDGTRNGDNEILYFEVEDTGIGIKEEDLPKLYKEYERIEESRNRNIEGTGLGMNITLQLLALMGSRLEVESVYGKGSKFSFHISQPITDETPLGNFEERVKNAAQSYEYAESFTAPDAKILVVDDNSMNRKVFLSLLKATKINITEASSGAESVSLAKENHYDIIFMDHMMPEMDGVEAMKRIRALESSPNTDTPIYVLTANAVTGAKEHYIEVGFDGFLSKPIVSEKLEKTIRETLPGSMLKPAEETEETESKGKPDIPEDLPIIDGLDWDILFLHLSDAELAESMLREFHTLIPVHANKLISMYSDIDTEEGCTAYRIQVHGMKSSAATIGIIPLAGMAKILEYAARDGNTDIIRKMHDIFINEWLSYKEKLKGVFGIGEEISDLPPADKTQTAEKLERLKTAMEKMEYDDADSIMAELLEFSYEDSIKEEISNLSAAVTDLDDVSAAETIDRILMEIS